MIKTRQQLQTFFTSRNKVGIKPGLDRVLYLLQKTDHPERELSAVHVAGTNGKGSVIQFMQEALIANGYLVGVFTSPSFIGLQGHFLINGKPAEEGAVIALVNQLMPAIRELDQRDEAPTSFEIITVIAFMYFYKKVDIALIETGMGGRLDTTNCFHPLLSIITNVAKDHTQYLGHSIAEIAHHKAGIIKGETPVVAGKLKREARQVIQQEAEKKQSTLYELGEDYRVHKNDDNFESQKINKRTLNPGLKGAHQTDNAAVAFRALQLLETDNFILQEKLVLQAFAHTTLPGRFEQIHHHPAIILDCAHNSAGIRAFIETVKQTDNRSSKKLLFAGFKDKQLDQMLAMLTSYFDDITLTTFSHERAAPVSSFQPWLENQTVNVSEHWQMAVDHIMADAENGASYYITGSLHFITLVRAYIMMKKS